MPLVKSNPSFLINVAGMVINKPDTPEVMSFEFEEGDDTGKAMSFQIQDFLLTYMDDPRFVEGTEVKWKFGYLNNLSTMFTGKIGEVECLFDSSAGVSMKVHVFDGVIETMNIKRTKEWKAPTADGWYFSDVVKKIATSHGMTADVEPTKFKHAKYQQSNESDWQFLKRMSKVVKPMDASKEGLYRLSFSADNKKLIFKPVPLAGPEVKTYVYYTETINPEIISFSPRSIPHDPTATSKNGVQDQDKGPDDENEGEESNNDTDTQRTQSEAGGTVLFNSVTAEEGEVVTGATTTEASTENGGRRNDAKEIAKNTANNEHRKGEMAAIEADLEVLLEPNLRRGDVIRLRGFGKKFSGKWMIKNLRAIIDSSGARNELELVKTTIADTALATKPAKGNPSGPGNPEKGQPIKYEYDATTGTGG